MHLAFTRWGLSPAALWSMTPKELAAALTRPGPAAARRSDLARLMALHPDAP